MPWFDRFNLFHILTRIERKVDRIMSSTDPLAGEIGQVGTDLAAMKTQNDALVALVQKLAAAAGVNTVADLAALQADDSIVTTVTADDVAAVAAANPPATPPASS